MTGDYSSAFEKDFFHSRNRNRAVSLKSKFIKSSNHPISKLSSPMSGHISQLNQENTFKSEAREKEKDDLTENNLKVETIDLKNYHQSLRTKFKAKAKEESSLEKGNSARIQHLHIREVKVEEINSLAQRIL